MRESIVLVAVACLGLWSCRVDSRADCISVDPLEIRLADKTYELTQDKVAFIGSDSVESTERQVGRVHRSAYCIRGSTAPVASSIVFNSRGLENISDKYTALNATVQVALQNGVREPSSLLEAPVLGKVAGMVRRGTDQRFRLDADSLGEWTGRVQAICQTVDSLPASCTLYAVREKRHDTLRIRLSLDQAPVEDWPLILREADALFKTLQTSNRT